MFNKKKKRPLVQADVEGGGAEYQHGGVARPIAPNTMQHYGAGAYAPVQPAPMRSRSARMSKAFGGGGHDERRGGSGGAENEKEHKRHGFVKKVFGKKDRSGGDKYGVPPSSMRRDVGGVIYSDDDEGEYDDNVVEDEEGDEEPQMLRHRRRFVRSGLTTYEQCISKNSGGRRFTRRSYLPSSNSTPSNVTSLSRSDGNEYHRGNGPMKGVIVVDKENSPVPANVSSLSSALQEVIDTRPTALKSVVDPSVAPARVQKSFVVEQTEDGNLFVMSKRVPSGPTRPARQTMDDSFIGLNRQQHDQFLHGPAPGYQFAQPAAGNSARHSELDFVLRQKWGLPPAASGPSEASHVPSSAVSLLSMSKVGAGVRRRVSGADVAPAAPLGADSLSSGPTALATGPPRIRRSSSSSKIADIALTNQMATMFMDHPRHRSRSRSTDGMMLPVMPVRKDSTAMLLQRGSFEDVDALPMTMDDLYERKPSIDKGPMTIDEFMFDAPPAPPPPPPTLRRKGSNGKSGRSKRHSRPAVEDEEEEDDNMLTRSFLNVKDVDALKRSRSLEEEEKVVTTTEETETEEEYPDYAEERATDDLGSSYEDESAVRTSNITEFLGGFKSRTSLGRNSLAGRNSAGRNSDFVSRAARSLRNSRKAAQESAKVSSELSRKLREARARVPHDLRGDPPAKKRSGFRNRDGKRVRFDMTRYCREFEVIEPEPSDDEVQQWSQRDSELDDDDDDDDDEDEHSTDDDEFGVPIPKAVLTAAMSDANAYYSNTPLNYTYPSRFSAARVSAQEARVSAGRASTQETRFSAARSNMQEDKRVSIVNRRSQANQNEVFM